MAQTQIGHEALTSNNSSALHTPGEMIEIVDSEGLKRYQYVEYESGSAPIVAAADNIAYYLDGTDWDGYTVTSDLSDTKANLVAGVLMAAITDEYYGWVQTYGYSEDVATNGDDDIAAGDAIIPVADGTVDSVAAGTAPTYKVIGWAVANDVDADDTVATHLTIM